MILKKRTFRIHENIWANQITEEHSDFSLHHLNLVCVPGKLSNYIDQISDYLTGENISILTGNAFIPSLPEDTGITLDAFGDIPMNLLRCDSSNEISIQITGLSGKKCQSFEFEEGTFGRSFIAGDLKYIYLTNYHGIPVKESGDSIYFLYSKMKEDLIGLESNVTSIIRTWIYFENIHERYNDFNYFRNRFFLENGIKENIIPASTGVETRNFVNSDIVVSALVIEDRGEERRVNPVDSPLQCRAINYLSSFSRAMIIVANDYSKLIISGTASIDEKGMTKYAGDIHRQINHTMEVVRAILELADMSWVNVVRSIAYFKDIKDKEVFLNYCKAKGLNSQSILIVQAEICRDDLLFEIEVDATV